MTKAKEALELLNTWNGDGNTYYRLHKYHDTIHKALTLLDKVEKYDENDLPNEIYEGFMCVQTVNEITDKYMLIERE